VGQNGRRGWPPAAESGRGHPLPQRKYVLYFVGRTPRPAGGLRPGIGVATRTAGGRGRTPARADPARRTPASATRRSSTGPVHRQRRQPLMYWGSYGPAVWIVQLSPDGLRRSPRRGRSRPVLRGPYVVKRDGWYYLLGVVGQLLRRPTPATVFAGRSKSAFGPFLDRARVSMNDSAGGTIVLAQTQPLGRRRPHSIVTDRTGQQWMNYTASTGRSPTWRCRPVSPCGRCCWTGWTGSTAGDRRGGRDLR